MIKVFEGKYLDGKVLLDGLPDVEHYNIAGIKVIFDLVEKPDIAERSRLEMQELLDKVKNAPKRFSHN